MTIPTPAPGCHQYQFGRRDWPLPALQTSIQFNFPLVQLTQNVNIKLNYAYITGGLRGLAYTIDQGSPNS